MIHLAPDVTSLPSCYNMTGSSVNHIFTGEGSVPDYLGATHQHAVVTVRVKQKHSGLRRHGNLFFGNLSIIWVEHSLTALTAIGCRGEVEEEGPCGLGQDWPLIRFHGQNVGLVICKSGRNQRQTVIGGLSPSDQGPEALNGEIRPSSASVEQE